MQFQADILNVPVIRPKVAETTALGAAYAAGWRSDSGRITMNYVQIGAWNKQWKPSMSTEKRNSLFASWKKAVTKTFDWIE